MDYATMMRAALQAPRPASRAMQASVMNQPSEAPPEINADLPLESVSPEDWIPNPKTLLTGLAKGGAGFAAITSKEALREAQKFASLLKGKEREALVHYTNTESPWHAGEVNYALRKGLPLPPDAQEYINTLTGVLRKSPKADTPFEIYRGMPREAAFANRPDPGFMSVTTDPDVAGSYAEMIMDNAGKTHDAMGRAKGIQVGILAPKGSPLVDPDVDKFWDDSELLMPRGSRLFHGEGDLADLILPKGFNYAQ